MASPWVAGVCSGLSLHLGIPVAWVRGLIVAGTFLFGMGALLYVWLWVTVPQESAVRERVGSLAAPQAKVQKKRSFKTVSGQMVLTGAAFLMVAFAVFTYQWWGPLDGYAVFPVVGVVTGLVMVWTQVPNLAHWKTPKVLSLIGSGTAIVVISAVFLVARNDPTDVLLRGALIGIVVLAGVGLALAPIWLGLLRNLSQSRTREARETERADIAAHLHDSVLQTLTLIRAAADDPARVRSLALTQERELRAWLYTGHADAGESVAQALREQIETVESVYGVEIDVVTVGDRVPGPGDLAAIAAAGEAATNAVRHGEPPVSVYMELTSDELQIFVKDSGLGFDVNEVPEDRHGVKDSIIGRVQRVGGTVRYRTREDDFIGTEVRISVPLNKASEDNND